MYFRNFIVRLRDDIKEGYKKTEILYINEGKKFIKCVAVNCINRLEKDIRLFKFPADNVCRQLAVLL